MDELISRQAALNIKFKDGILVQEDGIYVRADKVVEGIKALPTIQISCENGAEIEGYSQDTISRQAILALPRNITRNMRGKIVEESIDVEMIKALPPVQPNHNAEVSKMEIVHCKDCKRQDTNNAFRSMWCHEIRTVVKPDEFCCWAEKRGEAE